MRYSTVFWALLTIAIAALVRHAQQEQWIARARKVIHVLRSMDKRDQIPPVVSKEFDLATWPELVQQDSMPKDRRIFWGYWDKGFDAMPEFCKLAIRSWELRNPDWKVIVLDDGNYKQYVTPADLPSTYESLKVQTRSDLLGIAVLLRYGGVYLDVSTLLFRGLDEIWGSLPEETLALVVGFRYPGTDLEIYNVYLLMAHGLNNPVLKGWQDRALSYFEDPCLNLAECLAHPAFERVKSYIEDGSFRVFKDQTPYFAILWLLADMVWHDESIQRHILKLPTMQWGYAPFVIPHYFDEIVEEEKTGAVIDSTDGVIEGRPWALLTKISRAVKPFLYRDDPVLAAKLISKINALKFSALGVDFDDTKKPTTMLRVCDAAVDTVGFPTTQATLRGATRVQISTPN